MSDDGIPPTIDEALDRFSGRAGRPYLVLFRDGLSSIVVAEKPPRVRLDVSPEGDLRPSVQCVTKPSWSCFRADQVLSIVELDWPEREADEDDEAEGDEG